MTRFISFIYESAAFALWLLGEMMVCPSAIDTHIGKEGVGTSAYAACVWRLLTPATRRVAACGSEGDLEPTS